MPSGRVKLAFLLPCLILVCSTPQLLAKKEKPAYEQSESKRALHALNRLTFGPRPGDVQNVMAMGVDQWIDLQLHPEKINDKALEARLAPFRTLRMDTRELVENFPDLRQVKEVRDGKRSMPSDPALRAVYQVQIARLQDKQEHKATAGNGSTDGATGDKPTVTGSQNPATSDMNSSNNRAPVDNVATERSVAAGDAAGNMLMSDGTRMKVDPEGADASVAVMQTKPTAAEARQREDRLYADLKIQQLIDLPPDQRFKQMLGMSQQKKLVLANSLRGGKGQEFLEGMDPKQRETCLAMNAPPQVVVDELAEAKLTRAIYSERQLEEVMTDFWFNHFNVFIGKGADRFLITGYERDVIRPRVLGEFEDLLVATAKSPAMLVYLDNWLSVGPDSQRALGLPLRPTGPYGRRHLARFPRSNPHPNAKGKRNGGLNENYGRELMELHTLSVNGGYSQRDVTEVAKVFTGWTIDKSEEGGSFKFNPRMHEPGPKFVLGHKIKPKGEDEGRQVLHLLATSPQTAHFISLKLAQRFVADDPPAALVDRMAKTYLKKKGDIREVLTALFRSPEFWADDAYRAKVKTPLEFVASAVRATGADATDTMNLSGQLSNLGMPLYGMQPPTGYSMKAETWVNASALLGRMNFAVALTSGKVRGVKLDSIQLMGSGPLPTDSTQALATLENALLAGDVSKQTHDSIVARLEDPKVSQRKLDDRMRPVDLTTIAGLLLGSPEFQRR